MTYQFGDNRATYKRALAIGKQLIETADDCCRGPIEMRDEETTLLLLGWWRHINRTASAFFSLVEAGHTIEAIPLVRSIVEHTYSMIWLADTGPEGITVIEDATVEKRSQQLEEMRATGWKVPADFKVEEWTPRFPEEDNSPDAKRYRKLAGEFCKFNNLVAAFGSPDMYPVYRHLSDYTHASAWTANGYLHDNGDGTVSYSPAAGPMGYADVIWTTVGLIQAGQVIAPMLVGDPLGKMLAKAAKEYGVPAKLVPERPAPRSRRSRRRAARRKSS